MTAEEEQQIRERAYSIWEQEGRPQGRDVDHRLRAEAEITTERSRGGATAQQHRIRDDDHERLAKAAEALFKPKQQVTEQTIREGAEPTAKSARKPRILPILPKPFVHHEAHEELRNAKQQMTAKIARSQFARIRTLVKYGMTARQVAELYGVADGEIERILRRA